MPLPLTAPVAMATTPHPNVARFKSALDDAARYARRAGNTYSLSDYSLRSAVSDGERAMRYARTAPTTGVPSSATSYARAGRRDAEAGVSKLQALLARQEPERSRSDLSRAQSDFSAARRDFARAVDAAD